MSGKRYSPEEIIRNLREADVLLETHDGLSGKFIHWINY